MFAQLRFQIASKALKKIFFKLKCGKLMLLNKSTRGYFSFFHHEAIFSVSFAQKY